MRTLLILAGLLAAASLGNAETGANGWLRYSPLPDAARRQYAQMPGRVVSLADSPIGQTAAAELRRGVHSILGRDLAQAQRVAEGDAIVIGTAEEIHAALPAWSVLPSLRNEGFSLQIVRDAGHTYWIVAGKDDRGELYGVFHLLEQIAEERPFTEWFLKMSGIPDRLGRVGHCPNRIEAKSVQAVGYKPVDVVPWETAFGSKAVICSGAPVCSLTTRLNRPAGTYSIAVQYFDLNHGKSSYQLLLDGKPVASWKADRSLPSSKLDGHTSTRFTVPSIALAPGDALTLRGTPDGAEPAPVDYIEITPVNPL